MGGNAWFVAIQSLLQWVATKTSLECLICVGFCLLCWFAFMLWGIIGKCICFVIGFLYPMYGSFLAVEDGDKDQALKWVKYWMVFTSFTMFEYFGYSVIHWIPFYVIAKIIFFIWLVNPVTQGFQLGYDYFAVWIRKYRNGADSFLEESTAVVDSMMATSEVSQSSSADVQEYIEEELCRAADNAMKNGNVPGAARRAPTMNRNASPAPCISLRRERDARGHSRSPSRSRGGA